MVNEKRTILLQFLEEGTVMIHLDARRLGVLVPERFRGDPHLRLNLDYAFRVPDFEVGEQEIVATLSFSQRPYRCSIPWDAVWGVTSHKSRRNVLFPESIPMEVLRLLSMEQQEAARPGPGLRVVKAEASETAPSTEASEPETATAPAPEAPPASTAAPAPAPATEAEPPPDPEEPPPPRRGHLRLVKS